MNNIFVGKVQSTYIATDGSLKIAADGIIHGDWYQIFVRVANGDVISMVRGAGLIKQQKEIEFVADAVYQFEVLFSVDMCYRSGRNMAILTASIDSYKRV